MYSFWTNRILHSNNSYTLDFRLTVRSQLLSLIPAASWENSSLVTLQSEILSSLMLIQFVRTLWTVFILKGILKWNNINVRYLIRFSFLYLPLVLPSSETQISRMWRFVSGLDWRILLKKLSLMKVPKCPSRLSTRSWVVMVSTHLRRPEWTVMAGWVSS